MNDQMPYDTMAEIARNAKDSATLRLYFKKYSKPVAGAIKTLGGMSAQDRCSMDEKKASRLLVSVLNEKFETEEDQIVEIKLTDKFNPTVFIDAVIPNLRRLEVV